MEYGAVTMMAAEKTRTAKAVARATCYNASRTCLTRSKEKTMSDKGPSEEGTEQSTVPLGVSCGPLRLPTSKKAITSLVLGLIACVPAALAAALPFSSTAETVLINIPPPLALLIYLCLPGSLVFGHIARREVRKNPGKLRGSRYALIGLVFGYLSLASTVATLATLPTFFRQIEKQEEQSVVSCLHDLHGTVGKYYASHKGGYPATLAAIIAEDATLDPAFRAELNRVSWYTSGINDGYVFKYASLSTKRDGFSDAYVVYADPIEHDRRRPHFYMDQTGILRSEIGRQASATSPPVQK
jgi:hypothetical protein